MSEHMVAAPEDIATAMKHPGWGRFIDLCEKESIDRTYVEDWWPWWVFFEAGYDQRGCAA